MPNVLQCLKHTNTHPLSICLALHHLPGAMDAQRFAVFKAQKHSLSLSLARSPTGTLGISRALFTHKTLILRHLGPKNSRHILDFVLNGGGNPPQTQILGSNGEATPPYRKFFGWDSPH